MNEQQLKLILEGALLAAARPLALDDLLGLFDESERPERDAVRGALSALEQDYEQRSFQLKEVASGFRLQVKRELSPWVSRLWLERPSRYSRALLETLALVAYRQPITRGEIEDIRGVSISSSIMKTLQEREWIRVVGHRDVPGKPAMYATTRQFLDYFDLKSLDELPTLAELRDIDSINVELDLRDPAHGGAEGEGAAASAQFAPDDAQESPEHGEAAIADDERAAAAETAPGEAQADADVGESAATEPGEDVVQEPAMEAPDQEADAEVPDETSQDSAHESADAEASDHEEREHGGAEQDAAAQDRSQPDPDAPDGETDEDADPAQRWRENG